MVISWNCCLVIICTCVLQSACDKESVGGSLWGKKLDLMRLQCSFWQLHEGLGIPLLDEFTICVDFWKQIGKNQWTVFIYRQPGEVNPELGLDGVNHQLRVWLFGTACYTTVELPLYTWHSVCLAWSQRSQRIHLYITGSGVPVFTCPWNDERWSRRYLAPNGTLTLGVSHGFANGNMEIESGTSLEGSLSQFRMWKREYDRYQLLALRCAEGDVVRWHASDWDMNECDAVPDASLYCEHQPTESSPSRYPTASETTMALSTHITPASSQSPLSDSFFRVNLNVSVCATVLDPAKVIETWVYEMLDKAEMSVLNLRTTLHTQHVPLLDWRTLQQGEISQTIRHGCTFQVHVITSSDVAYTERCIRELLLTGYRHNVHGALQVKPEDIHIVYIEPGSCPQQSQYARHGFFTWPNIEVQRTATVPCSGNPEQKATRLCGLDAVSEQAKWTPPDLRSCVLIVKTILDLKNISVLPNNSMDILEIIGHQTSHHGVLSVPELTVVVSKLEEVVNVSQITPVLGTAIIDIISNITASTNDLSYVTNSILNIIDTIGNKMTISGERCDMVATSLAVSLIDVDRLHFQGLSFGVSSISEGSRPEVFFNQDPMNSTLAFISLPSVVQEYFPQCIATPTRVQFHFYRMLDLFEDKWSKNKLNTYVVSASVTNATIKDLERPVFITLQHLKPVLPNEKAQCVYWDFTKNDGLGGWESRGCMENHTSATHSTCFCDHLTHFGVLVDVTRTVLGEVDEEVLTLISYVGCGISSVFLGISVLTYAAFEKLRRDHPSKILLNLSLALLGLNLVFLLNSWLSSIGCWELCIAVAALQHYTLLASFTWMGLEAVHMYFALVKVFNVYVPAYTLKFCIVGWGVPLVMVALTLLIKMDAYGYIPQERLHPQDRFEQFCWLQDDVVFYASVIAYVLLVLLCNVSVFLVVLVQLYNMRENKPAGEHSGVLHDLRGVVSLTFLLGITWTTAFFTWTPAKVPLLYLFAILNSLQGFFIFIFYCLMKESVRKQWRIHLCCGRFRLAEHSDWSQTATVGARCKLQQLVHTPSVKSVKSDESGSTTSTSCSSRSGQTLPSVRKSSRGLMSDQALVFPRAHFSSSHLSPKVDPFPQWYNHSESSLVDQKAAQPKGICPPVLHHLQKAPPHLRGLFPMEGGIRPSRPPLGVA